MSIASIKLDLAKKIIDTNDKEIIGYIKAIFDGQSDNWYEELPPTIQASVERGLSQSKKGEGKPNAEILKKYKKWVKK